MKHVQSVRITLTGEEFKKLVVDALSEKYGLHKFGDLSINIETVEDVIVEGTLEKDTSKSSSSKFGSKRRKHHEEEEEIVEEEEEDEY